MWSSLLAKSDVSTQGNGIAAAPAHAALASRGSVTLGKRKAADFGAAELEPFATVTPSVAKRSRCKGQASAGPSLLRAFTPKCGATQVGSLEGWCFKAPLANGAPLLTASTASDPSQHRRLRSRRPLASRLAATPTRSSGRAMLPALSLVSGDNGGGDDFEEICPGKHQRCELAVRLEGEQPNMQG